MLSSKTHFGKIDFNGGNLSSDGGAILMMEYLEHIELIEQLRGIPFNDSRFLPVYSNTAIMFQCICRTLLGYHNQADQKVLLEDPLLCQYVDACSQPTISRFFDRITDSSCAALREKLIKMSCEYVNRHVADPLLDADSTLVTTKGEQEGASFIHHYAEVGFHPLLICESTSKLILSPILRTGSAYSSNGIIEQLMTVMSYLTNNGNIRFRGDSAFYDTKLMKYLEENRITYYIRAKNFSKQHSAAEADTYSKGATTFEYTHDHPYYSEMQYAIAGKKTRRIVYKAYWVVDQHNQQELIPVIYAVVTNDTKHDAKYVMDFYEARGASENFNKELKNDFNAGILSHESFNANDFEFLIKSLSYNLYHIFQMEVLEKDDQKLMMNTFRIRYQKIAAKVIHHARRVNLSFSSAYRNQNTFLRYYNKVVIQS